MRDAAAIEGKEHVPTTPMLVIPNRVDTAALEALEETLGGRTKVAWMIENRLRPEADVVNALMKHEARGFSIPPQGMSQEALYTRIRTLQAEGRHVVLLPGRPRQAHAATADVSPELLHRLLDAYPLPVLPVYVGMYRLQQSPFVVTEGEYDRLVVSMCPPVPSGRSAVNNVQAAWMEASANQAAQMIGHLYAARSQGEESSLLLPHALLHSLLAHPDALVMDGVDNTQMTYRQLMVRAATLARQLRLHVASKRIGIILPPGRFAIIANVACLLAGITPVNIDYHFNDKTFESASRQAGLDRLITENRFIHMQVDFPWPLTRDILFIDELPDTTGLHLPLVLRLLHRVVTPALITRWIHTSENMHEDDEALAVYAAAPENRAQGKSLSHRAVLSGAALSAARLTPSPDTRVLSVLPYYHPAGLLQGLIYPLLAGQDIITYSLPKAGKRLGELARLHAARLAIFTPSQAADVLATAEEQDFASTHSFLVTGAPTDRLMTLAAERHGIYPSEIYQPLGCAMPVACNQTLPPEEDDTRPSLPCGAPDTVGLPMPGVAVRITDMDDPLLLQPRGTLGLVWVKGPGMNSAEEESATTGDRPAHERWWCTGDVGMLREDGLLVVQGPRTRFSQIEGEIISHTLAERRLAKYLRGADEPGPPKLAVIGVQDEETGQDRLVLLSTIHKVLGPHDIITLRYALTNDHQSPKLTPSRIIPLRAIPTLPDGQVDYARCMSLYRYLQNK